jgi:uncharacterized membrane protein YphA (DoxX/SURF4 family)
MGLGSGLIIIGVILPGADRGELNTPRAFLLGGGLLALAAAVARRLQTAPQDIEARIGTASMMIAAAFGICLAYVGSPDRLLETPISGRPAEREWDSMRMVLLVLGVVTMVGAFLVLLPVIARKVAISLLILLHFTSICVSITSVPPPNGPAPWLSIQAWAYFFRPYASFMYLNNAYHFYSPEPGPPTLAWFYVTYDDNSGRWIKLPSRKDSPVPLHYQRLLALTESINAIDHNIPPNYNDLVSARRLAGKIHNPEISLTVNDQDVLLPTIAYQPPEQYSRVMIAAYSRYIAHRYPHPDENPDAEVKTVKAYRLVHKLITAPEMASGLDPDDEIFDYPYFMGEFTPEGEMINPKDPFLYFLLPITKEPERVPGGPPDTFRLVLKNRLKMHAEPKPTATEPQQ